MLSLRLYICVNIIKIQWSLHTVAQSCASPSLPFILVHRGSSAVCWMWWIFLGPTGPFHFHLFILNSEAGILTGQLEAMAIFWAEAVKIATNSQGGRCVLWHLSTTFDCSGLMSMEMSSSAVNRFYPLTRFLCCVPKKLSFPGLKQQQLCIRESQQSRTELSAPGLLPSLLRQQH